MPALKPCPGAIDVKFSFVQEGRPWSFHLAYTDEQDLLYTSGDLVALVEALVGYWDNSSHGQGRLSNEVSPVVIEATDLHDDTAPREFVNGTLDGGQSGAALPMNVAMRIKRTIFRRYRGGKSGIFIGGMIDSFLDTNQNYWGATYSNAFVTDIEALDSAAAGLTSSHGHAYVPAVVSRFTAHAERNPAVWFPVADTAAEPRVCTRRRRLPKIT